MWSAIKSDLFEFVNTVKSDTSKVVTKVLGDEANEKEEVSVLEKRMTDIRRSFITYSTPIEDHNKKFFDPWLRTFSLTSKAAEIAQVLDQEPDVSRFYADLVPNSISAEEFWARYFFRIALLQKGNAVTLEEDDEEEIGWEDDDNEATQDEVYAQVSTAPQENGDSNIAVCTAINPSDSDRLTALISENDVLKANLHHMTSQVAQLNSQLADKSAVLETALKQIADLTSELASLKLTPQDVSNQAPEDNVTVQNLTNIVSITDTPEPKKKTRTVSSDKQKTTKSKVATPKSASISVEEEKNSVDVASSSPIEPTSIQVTDLRLSQAPAETAESALLPPPAPASAPLNLSLEDEEEDSWA